MTETVIIEAQRITFKLIQAKTRRCKNY